MMRDVMRKGGIDTPHAAQEIIRQSKTRAVKFLAIGLVLFVLVIWLVLGLPMGPGAGLYLAD